MSSWQKQLLLGRKRKWFQAPIHPLQLPFALQKHPLLNICFRGIIHLAFDGNICLIILLEQSFSADMISFDLAIDSKIGDQTISK